MRIVLLGAPGAGKGTQCKRIAQRYGLSHLSSGDILRQQRAQGSSLGKKAQGYMDAGQLVPDRIIVEMMMDAIKKMRVVLDEIDRMLETDHPVKERLDVEVVSL